MVAMLAAAMRARSPMLRRSAVVIAGCWLGAVLWWRFAPFQWVGGYLALNLFKAVWFWREWTSQTVLKRPLAAGLFWIAAALFVGNAVGAMTWRPEVVRFVCNRLFDLSVLLVIGAALAQMAYARDPSLEGRVKRAITRLFRSPFGKQF